MTSPTNTPDIEFEPIQLESWPLEDLARFGLLLELGVHFDENPAYNLLHRCLQATLQKQHGLLLNR